MSKFDLRSIFSGVVLLFCISFVCLLPVTAALLAKLGIPWLAEPRQVSIFLTIFLLLSAVGFVWSFFAHRKLAPCLAGLLSLFVIFAGHEIVPSFAIFYAGIAGLVVASFANWRARTSKPRR